MKEERARILEMVAQGKVTAEEGARLIEALGPSRESAEALPKLSGRFLVVRFYESQEKHGTVRVPLELLDVAARFVPADAEVDIAGAKIKPSVILAAVREGLGYGEIVDIKDGDEWVKITIEGPEAASGGC